MTNTTTLAPTDAEILDVAEDFRSQYTHGGTTFDEFDEIGFARAIRAKWGAPTPASGEPAAYRLKDDEATEHYGKDVYVYYTPNEFKTPAAFKYLEPLYTAPPAQEARVPLTSEQQRCIAEAHNVAACEEYFNARPQIDYIANRRIFEAGFSKGYGITAAQKETPCAPTP